MATSSSRIMLKVVMIYFYVCITCTQPSNKAPQRLGSGAGVFLANLRGPQNSQPVEHKQIAASGSKKQVFVHIQQNFWWMDVSWGLYQKFSKF